MRKPTLELLTLARRIGEPSAVFLGKGVESAQAVLAEYGAAKVYNVDAAELDDYLVVPKADALAQIAQASSPAAILVTSMPLPLETSIATTAGVTWASSWCRSPRVELLPPPLGEAVAT